MVKVSKCVAVLFFSVILAVVVYGADSTLDKSSLIEHEAIPFVLETVRGAPLSFRPGNGPTLVYFFSAFCPDCRELTPIVLGKLKKWEGKVKFISVNVDGKRFSNAVKNFVSECSLPSPVLYDEIRGDFFVAADSYSVKSTPTLVLVDGGGKICGRLEVDEMLKIDEAIRSCL